MNGRSVIVERSINGGIQRIYKFSNGYGASVVMHQLSYGGPEVLWELAVIKFVDDHAWYITCITDDVVGYLPDAEVSELLDKIEALTSINDPNTLWRKNALSNGSSNSRIIESRERKSGGGNCQGNEPL